MAEEQKQEEAPKKKGKLMIIVIAVVALVVVAVALKMFLFSGKKEVKTDQATKQHKVQQQEESSSPESYAVSQLEPHVIGPFVVNLSDAGGDRYLKLKIVLAEPKHVGEKAKKEKESTGMSLQDVMIKDVIINVISAKTSDDLLSATGKEELKNELKTSINKALHKNLVQDIYFTEFIIQ